jgi:hypothetical protein
MAFAASQDAQRIIKADVISAFEWGERRQASAPSEIGTLLNYTTTIVNGRD